MNLSKEEIQEIIKDLPSDFIPTDEDYRLESEYTIKKYDQLNSRELGKVYTAILRSLGFEIFPPSLFRPYGTVYRWLEALVYGNKPEAQEILRNLENFLNQYEKPVLLVDHHNIAEANFMVREALLNPNLKPIFEKIKFMTICPCCIGGRMEVSFNEDGSVEDVRMLWGDLTRKDFFASNIDRFNLRIDEENLRKAIDE